MIANLWSKKESFETIERYAPMIKIKIKTMNGIWIKSFWGENLIGRFRKIFTLEMFKAIRYINT